jgi:hypothetical protein
LYKYSKIIVCCGTLIIWCIKLVLRPYLPVPNYFQPLLDIAPNLIGCMLIPFAAEWWFKKVFKLTSVKDVQLVCLLGLLLVVINEYLQLIPFFKRTFDYLDIAFSFVGVVIGYYWFSFLLNKKIAAA